MALSKQEAQQRWEAMGDDERNRLAEEALNNPALIQALAMIEDNEIETMLNSSASESDIREICYFRVQSVKQVRNWLNTYMRGVERPSTQKSRNEAEKLTRGAK